MNFDEYKQEILTSKQKYLFCVQVQKEPVSVTVESTQHHSITIGFLSLAHIPSID